jgi:hypothetical protein
MPVWPCDQPTLQAQTMHNNTQSVYGQYQDAVCGHPAQPDTSSRGKWAVKKKTKSMKKEACSTFVLHAITIMGTYNVGDSIWYQV